MILNSNFYIIKLIFISKYDKIITTEMSMYMFLGGKIK